MPARSHGKYGTRVYMAWGAMMQRCHNPNNPSFDGYGRRGITVCQAWHRFEAFYADVGDPPLGMELERINNDRGYEPGNVKWATRKQQVRNTRQNRLITYSGKTLCLSDWSNETGISRDTLAGRYRTGWPIERMLTEPAVRGRKHTEEAKARERKPKPPGRRVRRIEDPQAPSRRLSDQRRRAGAGSAIVADDATPRTVAVAGVGWSRPAQQAAGAVAAGHQRARGDTRMRALTGGAYQAHTLDRNIVKPVFQPLPET
jgi:hypothetical protein